mgnify:CR=1 FL=1
MDDRDSFSREDLLGVSRGILLGIALGVVLWAAIIGGLVYIIYFNN